MPNNGHPFKGLIDNIGNDSAQMTQIEPIAQFKEGNSSDHLLAQNITKGKLQYIFKLAYNVTG